VFLIEFFFLVMNTIASFIVFHISPEKSESAIKRLEFLGVLFVFDFFFFFFSTLLCVACLPAVVIDLMSFIVDNIVSLPPALRLSGVQSMVLMLRNARSDFSFSKKSISVMMEWRNISSFLKILEGKNYDFFNFLYFFIKSTTQQYLCPLVFIFSTFFFQSRITTICHCSPA